MDKQYPDFEEKILNVVDKDLNMEASEDITLTEKEYIIKKHNLFEKIKNKRIILNYKNIIKISIIGLLLSFLCRVMLIPIINKNINYSFVAYWIISPIGAFVFLALIVMLFIMILNFYSQSLFIKEKGYRIDNYGMKYTLLSYTITLLYIIYMVSYIIIMIIMLF